MPAHLAALSLVLTAGLALAAPGLAWAQVVALPAAPLPGVATPGLAPAADRTLGPRRLDPASGRYVARFGDGQALLTLEPRLQQRLERTLADSAAPYAATVLLDPRSGRILAMAEHSRAEPQKAEGLAFRAMSPAASIFKIVTAAALLEQGYSPEEPVCYHGGRHGLRPRLLEDDARRDRACLPLAAAFGQSTNVVFAKLADRGLTAELLRSEAQRFLFNASLPFALSVEPSRASIPADRFGLASTAAGFGEVRLSPLHAALLGAVVANRGVLVPPWLVELVEGGEAPPVQRRDEGARVRADYFVKAQRGTRVDQQNASLWWYRDGVCVHVHASLMGFQAGDEPRLEKVLAAAAFSEAL